MDIFLRVTKILLAQEDMLQNAVNMLIGYTYSRAY